MMETKDEVFPPSRKLDAQLVVPHVYLGSSYAAYAKDLLKEKQITRI